MFRGSTRDRNENSCLQDTYVATYAIEPLEHQEGVEPSSSSLENSRPSMLVHVKELYPR